MSDFVTATVHCTRCRSERGTDERGAETNGVRMLIAADYVKSIGASFRGAKCDACGSRMVLAVIE